MRVFIELSIALLCFSKLSFNSLLTPCESVDEFAVMFSIKSDSSFE